MLKKQSKTAANLPINRIDSTRIKIRLVLPMLSFPIYSVWLGQGQSHGFLYLEVEQLAQCGDVFLRLLKQSNQPFHFFFRNRLILRKNRAANFACRNCPLLYCHTLQVGKRLL